jgi:DNA polymerase-3 subunit gamma/tau
VEGMSVAAARSDVELCIVRLCTPELQSSVAALSKRISALEKQMLAINSGALKSVIPKKEKAKTTVEKPIEEVKSVEEEIPLPISENEEPSPEIISEEAAPIQPIPTTTVTEPELVSQWPEILAVLKQSCPLMAGVLKDSRAYIGGGRLLIDSKLSQFRELINSDVKYRDHIRKAAEQVLGVSYNLGPYRPTQKVQKSTDDPLLEFKKNLDNLMK